ncbi:hypothetical protein D9M68_764680 [compost metagenome]
MHAVEQLGAGFGLAAETVGGAAVREVRVHLARVDFATFLNEGPDRLGLCHALGGPLGARGARVHAGVQRGRDEAVVDEKIFLHRQPGVVPLQVARPVRLDPVAQRQVLRTGGRANGVGLHKAQPFDGLGQGGGREQAAGNGVAAQVGKGR